MTLPGEPLDPYEAFPNIPCGVVGAILDGRSEEGLALNAGAFDKDESRNEEPSVVE